MYWTSTTPERRQAVKSFERRKEEYLTILKGLGYTRDSMINQNLYLGYLGEYLEKSRKDTRSVESKDIKEFIGALRTRITRLGRPFSEGSIAIALNTLKGFFIHLITSEVILTNPMEDLDLKVNGKNSERGVFSVKEMEVFLDSIDLSKPYGQRDRSIFELMYSAGIRSSEVANLKVTDIAFHERVILIRQGKGAKDRYVPFGLTALKFMKLYLEDERKKTLKHVKEEYADYLYLSSYYGKLANKKILKLFNKHLIKSGIEKKNRTLHSIRHSTATHLLEAGAEIRHVAELLGHESIQTTTIYTHLMKESIKKAYKSAHPGENQYYRELTEEYLTEVEKLCGELERESEYQRKTRL